MEVKQHGKEVSVIDGSTNSVFQRQSDGLTVQPGALCAELLFPTIIVNSEGHSRDIYASVNVHGFERIILGAAKGGIQRTITRDDGSTVNLVIHRASSGLSEQEIEPYLEALSSGAKLASIVDFSKLLKEAQRAIGGSHIMSFNLVTTDRVLRDLYQSITGPVVLAEGPAKVKINPGLEGQMSQNLIQSGVVSGLTVRPLSIQSENHRGSTVLVFELDPKVQGS